MKLENFEIVVPLSLSTIQTDVEYQNKLKEILRLCKDTHLRFFEQLRRNGKCACGDMCENIFTVKIREVVFLEPVCSLGCCIQFLTCLHVFFENKGLVGLDSLTGVFQAFLNFVKELEQNIKSNSTKN